MSFIRNVYRATTISILINVVPFAGGVCPSFFKTRARVHRVRYARFRGFRNHATAAAAAATAGCRQQR